MSSIEYTAAPVKSVRNILTKHGSVFLAQKTTQFLLKYVRNVEETMVDGT